LKIKIVIIAILLLCSCSKQEQSSIMNKPLWPEKLVINSIDISSPALTVTESILSSGQWQLINIWATWCAPCRKEMPLLQQLSAQLSEQNMSITLLSIDDDINLIKEFVLQHNIYLPVYVSKEEHVKEMLNISSYPMTFLINPKGEIIKSFLGVREWSSKEMVLQLKMLINGGLNE